MIKKAIIILLTIILLGCSSIKIVSKKETMLLIDEHLKNWENFRFDGIIDVNYKAYSLHKYFSLRRDELSARIDIYDSGLLGMKPHPFISIYYDSLIQARIPDIPEIKVINPQEYPEYFGYFILFDSFDLLEKKKSEIAENSEIIINDHQFFFDNQKRIIKIIMTKDEAEIELIYKDKLSEININKSKKRIISMQIDEINYNIKKIPPLIK